MEGHEGWLRRRRRGEEVGQDKLPALLGSQDDLISSQVQPRSISTAMIINVDLHSQPYWCTHD
jgi:hypothetical protein